MFPLDDTIAAIASPSNGAARGIVRISGPRAVECLDGLFHREQQDEDSGQERLAHSSGVVAGSLHLAELHSPLPCEVYLWCGHGGDNQVLAGETPAPQVRSYTGQAVAEIHTIGSPPLLQMVLRAICAAGARLAGPGEFTLRAFLAGRIDLTQAEAVLGVIDADDGRALAAALGQLAGGLARPLHRLRDNLIELLAHVEAGLDFADEDLPFVTRQELDGRLAEAEKTVDAIQRQMDSRAEPVGAVRAVLVGRPNTGKSSLFNALAGEASALVSHQAGTTRDYLTMELDLDGVKCRLIDTAGTGDMPLETSHVEHAAQVATETQRQQADVQVLCLDSTRPMDDWERGELDNGVAGKQIVVLTKCDAARGIDYTIIGIETSSVSGKGIETVRSQLRQKALAVAGTHSGVVGCTAARCRESLRLAWECLRRARDVAAGGQEELAAAEIRVALDELGKVVGVVYTEDILDRIFSRFCIGK